MGRLTMMHIRTPRLSTLAHTAALAAAAALAGCSGDPALDGTEALGEAAFPIIGGTAVSSADNPGAVAVYHNYIRPCSGALLRRQWVLTAHHCVTADGSTTGPSIPLNQIL